MNERIEALIAAGRLERLEASDDEIAGVWANALRALSDASLASQSLRGRLTDAYDAARLAAHAIVRGQDLRVRAANHHEMTIATAAMLASPPLSDALNRLQAVRTVRIELEYGWGVDVKAEQVTEATALAREIIEEGARHLRAERPGIKARIKLPK